MNDPAGEEEGSNDATAECWQRVLRFRVMVDLEVRGLQKEFSHCRRCVLGGPEPNQSV